MRFNQPEVVNSKTVIIVALAGVLVNGFTALMFMSGRKDINIRGAFLHMASDAAISFGVIIGAVVILYSNWMWVDPLLCIGISFLILLSSWTLFRESINLILHAVPSHIDSEKVRSYILSQENVQSVHDLHIWAISTSETALSVHVVTNLAADKDDLVLLLSKEFASQFHIHHSTIHIENQALTQSCEVSCNR
jgi:cobalt-zinc-cadmium efflux system protein